MTRETLENAKELMDYISDLERKLKKSEARATSSVTSLSGAPGGTAVSDKVGKGATEIADLKNEIKIKRIELCLIFKWITKIDPPYIRRIIIRRYLFGDSLRRISRDFGIDRRKLKALIEQTLRPLLQEV